MRYVVKIKDQFGNSTDKLVTKKELNNIIKFNPQLTVEIKYQLSGKFSYEK